MILGVLTGMHMLDLICVYMHILRNCTPPFRESTCQIPQ